MHFPTTALRAALCAALVLLLTHIHAPSARAATPPATSAAAAQLEGELEVLVEDYSDGRSRTRHFLRAGQRRVELLFARKPASLLSGTRVRVRGQLAGDTLALDGVQADGVETLATVTTSTLGEQKVAVILVNFQDDASQPITTTAARTLVFGTVDAFYRENSFQQTWLTGDVHGWFNIPVSRTTCNTELIAQKADQAAIASGVDLSRYARTVYMFPANACTWAGLATVGGSPSRAWINGVFSLRVVGHELGHSLGLVHAGGLDCDTGALTGTCKTLAYGDGADLMGNRAAHFNATEKEYLAWLNDGVSPPIAFAGISGRYTIEPYSGSGVGTKAIKIPRGTDPATGKPRWYYVEYRQPIGADAIIANTGNLTKGVLLRAVTEGDGSGSLLLDMTPNSDPSSGFADLEDGALAVGRSYTDSGAGVTVSLAAADSTGATIDVSYGGTPAPTCTRAAPTLTLTGPTGSLMAGTTANYTVTLTNKDSSACAATTFALARSIPNGWGGTLAGNSFTLSPGATVTTALSVTSPVTASAGSYGIGVGTSSSAGSPHTANVSATYSVTPSTTLSETVGTDKAAYVRGETVRISALVRSNGAPVAGATVKFTVSGPSGISVVLNASSASDGYARTTYKIGKGKAAAGNYAVRADASSGGASATASTAFAVQ
ncbi:MAG TPA: NEW3 domain-containing protein [Lysobacter sp.]|nr:NEW3 domain-containing protein [Lysobacter sp.]